jgi:transcriptional regulator with XRE-family HTH domain
LSVLSNDLRKEMAKKSEWFAGRLRELRERAGWTQQQIADASGLTLNGVAQIERGVRSPSWEVVVALCEALDVECCEFLKEPKPQEPRKAGRPFKNKPPSGT